MPTPDHENSIAPLFSSTSRSAHATCPPDDEKDDDTSELDVLSPDVAEILSEPSGLPTPPLTGEDAILGATDATDSSTSPQRAHQYGDIDNEVPRDIPSPISVVGDSKKEKENSLSASATNSSATTTPFPLTLQGLEIPSPRVCADAICCAMKLTYVGNSLYQYTPHLSYDMVVNSPAPNSLTDKYTMYKSR